ncbi:Polygalacturonase [Stylosanthes scabra]|uniref:Polygalacturonase n=1 Tax=Stylosanthes scabra TaxID=79078 RepID=A0ABU6Y802_9FABA|nr:Polygalacturonase [Stylosanthes scabra]
MVAFSKCHPEDQAAVLRIKGELRNPQDLTTWNASTDGCGRRWKGVSCNMLIFEPMYRVNNIDLLTITLPKPTLILPSLVDLRSLIYLRFSRIPNLTGSIPDFLSSIKTLTTLDFSYSKLSDPLPASLSSLSNLHTLDLRNNDFSGTLPQSLTELKFLKSFNVSYNKLCGPTPQGGNLQRFDASAYAGGESFDGGEEIGDGVGEVGDSGEPQIDEGTKFYQGGKDECRFWECDGEEVDAVDAVDWLDEEHVARYVLPSSTTTVGGSVPSGEIRGLPSSPFMRRRATLSPGWHSDKTTTEYVISIHIEVASAKNRTCITAIA